MENEKTNKEIPGDEVVVYDAPLSLLTGGDVARNRLNAWLSGGGGGTGVPLEIGTTLNHTTTSVDLFTGAAALPSPFALPPPRLATIEAGDGHGVPHPASDAPDLSGYPPPLALPPPAIPATIPGIVGETSAKVGWDLKARKRCKDG
jgi:hypothetical protein